jgi:hypothetical protein
MIMALGQAAASSAKARPRLLRRSVCLCGEQYLQMFVMPLVVFGMGSTGSLVSLCAGMICGVMSMKKPSTKPVAMAFA